MDQMDQNFFALSLQLNPFLPQILPVPTGAQWTMKKKPFDSAKSLPSPPSSLPICVVLPIWNRWGYLQRSLQSVLKQSLPPQEVILVDDGSDSPLPREQGTKWAELFKAIGVKFRVLRNSEPLGVSQARNRAITETDLPWVALLDSDDEWLPRRLEAQIEVLGRRPDLKLVHGEEIWVRRGVRVNPKKKHKKRGGRIFSDCVPRCCVSPSATLVHRKTLLKVGLFDEGFPVCEDYDLWLRFCAEHEVGFVTEPILIKYGGHPNQLSNRYKAMDFWRVLALKNILNHASLTPTERQRVVQTIQNKCKILQKGYQKHQSSHPTQELNHYDNDLIARIEKELNPEALECGHLTGVDRV